MSVRAADGSTTAAAPGSPSLDPWIRLPRVPVVQGRTDVVVSRCAGKRVLHVGCSAAGFEERLQMGTHMHLLLSRTAAELWGMDSDDASLEHLRRAGFDRLLVGDASTVGEMEGLRGKRFDVVVASEVVEHLSNPGLFLDSVRTLMEPGVGELVITVPNAYRIDTLLSMLRGIELNHPDHNYWFSYHTITTLVKKHGYAIHEVLAYTVQSVGLVPARLRSRASGATAPGAVPAAPGTGAAGVGWIRRVPGYVLSIPKRLLVSFLYALNPFWADGIVVVARPLPATPRPE